MTRLYKYFHGCERESVLNLFFAAAAEHLSSLTVRDIAILHLHKSVQNLILLQGGSSGIVSLCWRGR